MVLRVLPVIMSGGVGARLWPLSTEERPKQFHDLLGQGAMIRATVERLHWGGEIEFLPPLIVCNARHGPLVLSHIEEAQIAVSGIVLEPFGRSTAPVAGIASLLAQQLHPGCLVLLAPSDHHIADAQAFNSALRNASSAAHNWIITLGIQPDGPATGYGYIQQGDPISPGVFQVARFHEKPSRIVAEEYVEEGGYWWNAGIFLFDPGLFMRELRLHRPEIAASAAAAVAGASRSDRFIRIDPTVFAACPSDSIDYAVMEKTAFAAVAPCDIGWADVGSWNELWRLAPKTSGENVTQGRTVSFDVRDSLLWSTGPVIAALGLEGIIVVATPEAVLVAPLERAQEVRELALRGNEMAQKPNKSS